MTTVLLPNGDGSRGSWTNESSGTSNIYQSVDEQVGSANDSDYALELAGTASSLFFLLQDTPSDFSSISTVSVQVRGSKSGSGTTGLTLQIFKSDESTALTNSQTTSNLSSSNNNFSVSLTVTGATDKTSWDGARLKIVRSASTSPDVLVSAVEVDITYTAGGGGGGSGVGVIGGGVTTAGVIG